MITTVCHWNIRGFQANYFHMRQLLADSQAVVLCLQETKMPAVAPSPPRSFVMYQTAGPTAYHGGVATLVKTTIGHTHLPLITDLQAVAVRCHLDRMYTICNLYLPPSDPLCLQQLHDLVAQLPEPFLLVGDFNARHPLWGDTVTSLRGRILESFLTQHPCSVLNEACVTHYHPQTATFTAIDLTITSSSIAPNFSWYASEDLYNSDHFPVLLVLRDDSCRRVPVRYIFDRADWELYRRLAVTHGSAADFPSVDEALDHLLFAVRTGASAAIPTTNPVTNTRRVPWWNRRLQQAVEEKKAATRRYYRTRLVVDKIAFNRACATVRYLVKSSRQQSWKSYVSSINERTPMSKIWHRVGRVLGRRQALPRPVLETDAGLLSAPAEVADAFGAALSSVCQGSQDPLFLRHKLQAESAPVTFPPNDTAAYNKQFTLSELSNAFRKSSNKAPGEDNVPLLLLRNLPPTSLLFLLSLYNRVWSENVFPSSWRGSVIIPIHKKGTSRTQPLNYRPIALTSTMCKIMERMVNIRLVWHLEESDFLHRQQYGFRRCRSSLDALLRLDSYIKSAFTRREHVVAVFFDLHKAYDRTWRHHVLQQLKKAKFVGNLPRFVQNFLTARTIKTRVGSVLSDPFPQQEGVPQGSVLSCTLFSLAINDLPDQVSPGVQSSLYVDDFAIFVRASSLRSAVRQIQLSINRSHQWVAKHGFEFSTHKTVCMHFTRCRGLFPPPDLFLGTTKLASVPATRFLGLTLDTKLTYLPHIRDLRQRAMRSLDLLKSLAGISWGADRCSLLRIYRAVIRSKLDYGCQVYDSAPTTTLRMLDTVHHQALRICSGAFRTSPVQSLYADLGEPSLYLRRQKLQLQTYVRVLGTRGCPTRSSLLDGSLDEFFTLHPTRPTTMGFRARSLLSSLLLPAPSVEPSISYLHPPYDNSPTHLCPGIMGLSKTDTPPSELRYQFADHRETHTNTLSVFTDGCKRDDGVGYAAVFPTSTRSRRLPDSASIFTAELKAILIAVAQLCQTRNKYTVIYADSRSALQSVCDTFSLNPIALQVHTWLWMLRDRGRHVSFCWVPSHVGVEGNELADRAASAVLDAVPVAPPGALPYRDYFPSFRQSLFQRWQLTWTASFGKLREIKASIQPWASSYRRNRREETILARLRIGHSRLTHSYLLLGEPPPHCDDCVVPLTVEHILSECPTFSEQRLAAFGVDGVTHPLPLADILGDNELRLSQLFPFLHAIDYYHQI